MDTSSDSIQKENEAIIKHENIYVEGIDDEFEITNDDLESEIITMEETVIEPFYEVKEPGQDLNVIRNHVDEIIEEVVQNAASTVTDQEMFEHQIEKSLRMRSGMKQKNVDPLSLPFRYPGQSFNIQSQKLILNTLHFLKEHKYTVLESVKTAQEKAAKVLNVSMSVISKLRRNWKLGKLEQAGKKKPMMKRILDRISEADEGAIRQIIKDQQNAGSV